MINNLIKGSIIDYALSYIAVPLMPVETKAVVELYLSLQNWDDVKAKVIEEDVLQKPTLSSRKRTYSEIKKRVLNLTPLEMDYFVNGSMEDVRVLSFVSCLKTYRLIYEFVLEVVREKYLMFDYQIESSDYVSFMESKEASSAKLSSVSDSTKYRLKQVMFFMLSDVGLIESTKNHYITTPILSDGLIKVLLLDDPKLLLAFLMNNDDIQYHMKRVQ